MNQLDDVDDNEGDYERPGQVETKRLVPFLSSLEKYLKVTFPAEDAMPYALSLEDVSIEIFHSFEHLLSDFQYISTRFLMQEFEFEPQEGQPIRWIGFKEYVSLQPISLQPQSYESEPEFGYRYREHVYIVKTARELYQLQNFVNETGFF